MTLHNQALMNIDMKPSEGFEKLAFLLQLPSFPRVTFGNLLLLYSKHEVPNQAEDHNNTKTFSVLKTLQNGSLKLD